VIEINKIYLFVLISLFGCNKNILPPDESIIEAILDKGDYYNLITSVSDTLISNPWHISLQYDNVVCAGMEAPMYIIIINEGVSVNIVDETIGSDLTAEDFNSDLVVSNESLGFNGSNEVIHYSGCDDNFETHNVSVNNTERVYLLHDTTTNNYFKLQFVDFISPTILFQYSIIY
tara:strand:- start:70 stop:594 length:525 start_codon:yes stop_codon:yes gene_type:complete